MNHLNAQISTLGRESVLGHLAGKGVTPDADDVIETDGKRFYLVISTKRHKVIDGSKATGLNAGRIETIKAKARKLKVAGVYLVFVDAKLALCYGGYLEKLLQKKEFDGITWPLQNTSPFGLITYFSVFHMHNLFTLDPVTVQRLNELGSDNKADKNQLKLL